MDKLLTCLIILGLVLLNALFVAAEFAIVSVPRSTMESRAGKGDRLARIVVGILRDPRRRDRYIATAQLGISVASLLLGMYGEHKLAEWIVVGLERLGMHDWLWFTAHGIASVLAVVVLTYFHIVLGEMIPKSVALQRPEQTSSLVTPPLLAVQTVARPLIAFLSFAGDALLRAFGVDRHGHGGGHEHVRTPEELRSIVRESQAGGMLRGESAAVVQELLDFAHLTAGEVMVPRVRVNGLRVGMPFDEVVRVVGRHPHTRYPVYRGDLDHILGMVHIKDLFRRLRNRRAVHEHDAREVPFVPETATIDEVMAALRAARTQLAVVMDEHGGTAGIVTIEDLFEEVVGDIEESAGRRPELFRDDQGRARVAGTVRVEEVGEFLGVVLEHDEVDSVSGLVLDLLGRPPVVGDTVEYDDVRFEVSAIAGHGVREALVTMLKPPQGHPAGSDEG
jgi:CBS domain containing-hemolysin-like protein